VSNLRTNVWEGYSFWKGNLYLVVFSLTFFVVSSWMRMGVLYLDISTIL